MKESALAAYPPMIIVFMGLVLFAFEWVLARPLLLAFLGLGAVGLITMAVALRDRQEEQIDSAERQRLIARWSKRNDHRRKDDA